MKRTRAKPDQQLSLDLVSTRSGESKSRSSGGGVVLLSDDGDGRVRFLHFEGVAPRKYQELFLAVGERKSSAGATRTKAQETRKSAIQYLDSYRDLESKVVQSLVTQGLTENVIVELTNPAVMPQR